MSQNVSAAVAFSKVAGRREGCVCACEVLHVQQWAEVVIKYISNKWRGPGVRFVRAHEV